MFWQNIIHLKVTETKIQKENVNSVTSVGTNKVATMDREC